MTPQEREVLEMALVGMQQERKRLEGCIADLTERRIQMNAEEHAQTVSSATTLLYATAVPRRVMKPEHYPVSEKRVTINRHVSPAGKKRIAEAQKRRWARYHRMHKSK